MPEALAHDLRMHPTDQQHMIADHGQDWPDEPCDFCGGDGHLYTRVRVWDRYQEQHYPDWRNAGPCPRCDGTG